MTDVRTDRREAGRIDGDGIKATRCGNLGQVYLKGEGLALDLSRGLDLMHALYRKGCEVNVAAACAGVKRLGR